MDEYEEFVQFLENNPAYYKIINSAVFMSLLTILNSAPRSFSELLRGNQNIEEGDLETMLAVLEDLEMVKQAKSAENRVFYATEKTRGMLSKFEKVKDRFRVA